MLKRLRRLRSDAEKPSTPPGSPPGQTSTGSDAGLGDGKNLAQEGWDKPTAEGFLCPMCMNKFQNPEELQQHFETVHDDTTAQKPKPAPSPPKDAVFLCPQCKDALPSAAALEAHFISKHGSGFDGLLTANRDGDVLALRQEMDDLRTTLKEEKWYSAELRKELEKHQGYESSGGVTDEEKVELDLIKQQLRASEETRILLTSEVGHLREQLTDANTARTCVEEAKTTIEQKAAKLSGEIVGAKARVDEIEGQRVGFEDHIKTLTEQLAERNRYVRGLESQLAQRPGADDVLVLRKELVNAQTLMDQMTQDQEKEKQQLEEEHARLKADFNKSESKLQDLHKMLQSAPRVEEIEMLKAATSSSSNELNKQLAEREATIAEREKNVEQLKEALHDQVGVTQMKEALLSEVQRNHTEVTTALDKLKVQLKDTEADLVSHKENVARLEERTKLMDSQRQEKEVTIDKFQSSRAKTEALNETLQAEKLRLAKELEAAKLSFSQKDAELKEMSENSNQLQQQIEKRDGKISEKQKLLDGMEGKLAEARQSSQASSYEKENQLTAVRAELDKAEANLKQQEASRGDLQKHIADLQHQLQVEAKNVEEGRATIREKNATLEELHRTSEVKVAKVSELTDALEKVKENVARLDEERTDLLAKIEAGEGVNTAINQLKQENCLLQERLSSVETSSEHVAKEHQEKVDLLHKQLQEGKITIQEVNEASAKVEENLKVSQERLKETIVKVSQLEGELQTKSELLLAAETAKTIQRTDLENHIKTVQNVVDEKFNEIVKVEGQLDQIRQEYADETSRATRLEANIKEQTLMTNSLQQKLVALEADLVERTADLDRIQTAKAAQQEELQGQIDTALANIRERETSLEKSGEALRAMQVEKKTLGNELTEQKELAKDLLQQNNSLEAKHHQKVEELKKVEQTKRSVETQLKVAQDTISEKTAQLEKTQGSLESSMAQLKDQHTKACAEATTVQNKLKHQIETLESSRNQLLEENTLMTLSLEDTKTALISNKHELDETKSMLTLEVGKAEAASNTFTQQVRHLEGQLASYTEELAAQQKLVAEKTQIIAELHTTISGLEGTKLSLEGKLIQIEQTVATNANELNEKGDLLLKVKEESEKKETGLTKELQEASAREANLQRLMEEALGQSRKLEEQVQAGKEVVSILETALADKQQELNEGIRTLEKNREQVSKSLQDVNEAKKNIENKLTDVNSKLEEVSANRDELKQNKAMLEQTLLEQQELYKDLRQAKGNLDRELQSVISTAQSDKLEKTRELKERNDACDLLIGQKMELHAQVTSLGTTLANLRTQYDECRDEAAEIQTQLKVEVSESQAKILTLREENTRVLRQKEEWTAQHELHITTLKENLTTIRGDLLTAQARLADADKTNTDLRGEKLELEAKLDNNNGERRSLLERCLTSEAEVQQLQEKVTEVRRKLDDTQAALHELGRENQSLQIFTNKASSRKWADDNEVIFCITCNKMFSMTIRKHHCRHCGNIFCNECSSKLAAVAASKKPVRVCDSCYTDLTSRS